MARKNLGATLELHPMPLIVLGTVIDGKNHWMLVGHSGIMDHSTIEVSIHKSRKSQEGIRANNAFSVNLVTEDMVSQANKSAFMNGHEEDKSGLFEAEFGEVAGAPLIKDAPISMACEVVDVYECGEFDCFIAKVAETLVDERYLEGDKARVDFEAMAPVMFAGQRLYYKVGQAVEAY